MEINGFVVPLGYAEQVLIPEISLFNWESLSPFSIHSLPIT